MKKYGLQLRIPPSQQKKPAAPKPLARPSIFGADDDEDVEKEISRQASKNKAAQKVEEQHKKALEEDPSVFDYDGVFDEMKGKIAKPRVVDRAERQAKYIPGLLKKSEERKREQDVIYERKLLKERSKDDHLFADKEKFVTKAYKQKLAEEQKWLEEERLRQIREEKEDVTKMKDMSSFYFGLDKNIAFGASSMEAKGPLGKVPENDRSQDVEATKLNTEALENDRSQDVEATKLNTEAHIHSVPEREEVDVPMKGSQNAMQESEELDGPVETSRRSQAHSGHAVTTSETTVADATSTRVAKVGEDMTNEIPAESFKRSEDAVSAARERYLARKRAREQE